MTVVQPALPAYRIDFFDRLSRRLGPGFSVYASRQDGLGALEATGVSLAWHHDLGSMRRLSSGLAWQAGVLSIPLARGDVLVVAGEPRTISTLVLIIKARLKGARVAWWGHFWSATSRPWRAAIRFALMRLPDALVFYTDMEVAEYRVGRGGGATTGLVFGLNNGIATAEIVARRAPYHPAARRRNLLFIGRITPKAELDLLIEALARRGCAGVTLDIIGDGAETARLRDRADALGLEERIVWHGAILDEAHIAEIANACKAFAYPGAVGLSLIHGLAYGLPAIVHDDRWRHMPEIAAHRPGKNGVTFRQGDADALAEAVAGLLAKPNQLERMSAAAAATTERSFNTADMAERFVAVVEALA